MGQSGLHTTRNTIFCWARMQLFFLNNTCFINLQKYFADIIFFENIIQSASSWPTEPSQPAAGRQGLLGQLQADRCAIGHAWADYWPSHVALGAVGAGWVTGAPVGQLPTDRPAAGR